MLIITIGSILKRYDDSLIDLLFWAGIVFSISIIGVIVVLIINISKKTKEIGEL